MVSSCLPWTFSNCTARKACLRNRRRAALGSNRTSSPCSSHTKVSRPPPCAAYNDDVMGTIYAVVATCTWFTWFLCLCLSDIGEGTASIAWMLYVFFVAQVAIIRYQVRAARSIRDNFLNDLFATFAMYPMVISQMELEAPYIEQRKQV